VLRQCRRSFAFRHVRFVSYPTSVCACVSRQPIDFGRGFCHGLRRAPEPPIQFIVGMLVSSLKAHQAIVESALHMVKAERALLSMPQALVVRSTVSPHKTLLRQRTWVQVASAHQDHLSLIPTLHYNSSSRLNQHAHQSHSSS